MYSIFYIMKKINLNISENMDEEQIILIEQYNKLIKKEKKLNKSIEKLKKKKKSASEEMKRITEKRKQTFNILKKRSLILFTSVSIVYDKRWETYICIFKNSNHQKSFYIGKHQSILDSLSPYYEDNIPDSIEFLKGEIKKIINTIKTKIITVSPKGTILLNNLKLDDIVDLYSETGNWTYWSLNR